MKRYTCVSITATMDKTLESAVFHHLQLISLNLLPTLHTIMVELEQEQVKVVLLSYTLPERSLDEILALGDYGINGNAKAEILKTETNKWVDVLDYPFDRGIKYLTYYVVSTRVKLSQPKPMCTSVILQSSILTGDFMLLVD